MNSQRALEELHANPEMADVLQTAISLEEQHGKDENYLGWQWFETRASSQLLNHMVRLGLVDVRYKSNNATHYKVADVREAKALLKDSQAQQDAPMADEPVQVPDDIFDVIILHQHQKELLLRSLRADKPVHALLIGSIGSGKTLFLQELARLPHSEYVLSSRLSGAGVYDVMFSRRPRYLILDELDKLTNQDDVSALLSLMETGILSEAKYRRRRQDTFETWVFAGANYEEKIPPEILSRFGAYKLRFPPYSAQEFLEVATNVMVKREGLELNLARYIASQVLGRMGSKDVRDARSIARTATDRQDVDRILDLLLKKGA